MNELKIKKSLLFCFLVWLMRGGYKMRDTKRDLFMCRGDKEVFIKLKDDEYLEMNELGRDRYSLFLSHWLDGGVKLLKNLNQEGNRIAKRNNRKWYMELRK